MILFSKCLSLTDVSKRLAIPTSCLKNFPSFEGKYSIPLHVLDQNGEEWIFVCSARKNGYPKPCFIQGWLRYVNSKRICVGDRVHFYKDAESEVYRIELHRRIRLFGHEYWSKEPPDQRQVNFEKRTEAEADTEAEAEVIEVQTGQSMSLFGQECWLHQPPDQEQVNFEKTTEAKEKEKEKGEEEGEEKEEEESKKNNSS